MKTVLPLYKPVGITPLQLIRKFQLLHPEYQKIKLGYAGRLDPMAEGILLVLAGDENKRKQCYEQLPKQYVCDMLIGFETDTYDILGKIVCTSDLPDFVTVEKAVGTILPVLKGSFSQPYPPYSSKAVNGKPLFWYAREKKLSKIHIPVHDITIFTLTTIKSYVISKKDLHALIHETIRSVTGEFRQKEIQNIWDDFFRTAWIDSFPVVQLEIKCSSGTYIRSLVHEIGKKTGWGAISLKLLRTDIGPYSLNTTIRL